MELLQFENPLLVEHLDEEQQKKIKGGASGDPQGMDKGNGDGNGAGFGNGGCPPPFFE